MIESGKHLRKLHGAIVGLSSIAGGGADDLAVIHATSRQEGGGDIGPVIPPGSFIDLGRASELAPDHHAHVLLHAAVVQVLHQGGNALIQEGKVLAAPFEVSAVPVPAAEAEGDAAGTGLYQATGHEELVKPLPGTVRC